MEKVKKPMKKRTKIFLKVLSAIAIIIVIFILVTAIISAVGVQMNVKKAQSFENAKTLQLDFDNYDDGCYNIKSDNGLKVMQLTDVHIGGGWATIEKDAKAINAVASMITAEKPDFVVVTGDVSYPVPFQSGTFNNKSGAKVFAELMESLGVYWTIAYGNHDTEAYSYYSREALTKFYSSDKYKHCLLQAGPKDVDGVGNQVFNIVNSGNVITRSLIVFDSHSYTNGDWLGIKWSYDNIHENQIEWYKTVIKSINDKNKNAIAELSSDKANGYSEEDINAPTTVFFHIPRNEYQDAWDEYKANGYKDTENVKYIYGYPGETDEKSYGPVVRDNMFNTMLELKSTDSAFCGHDHFNNFAVNYKGINLCNGLSIDYLAYFGIKNLGTQRGCTIIDYAPNGDIDFHQENYYQNKYPSKYPKEEVTVQDITKSGDMVNMPDMS